MTKFKNIKSLNEAFNKYEPDIHYSNYLNEENIAYSNDSIYNIGDIVYVVQYKYSSGKLGYGHLFLLVDKIAHKQFLGMLISSKLHKARYKQNVLILKDKYNNLKKDSIIKTDEVYKLIYNNILFKIGNLSVKIINEQILNM